jgi:hypothetical protein
MKFVWRVQRGAVVVPTFHTLVVRQFLLMRYFWKMYTPATSARYVVMVSTPAWAKKKGSGRGRE